MRRISILLLLGFTGSVSASLATHAFDTSLYDVFVPGYTHQDLWRAVKQQHQFPKGKAQKNPYTLIPYHFATVKQRSEQDVARLIHRLQKQNAQHSKHELNNLVKTASQYFSNQHISYSEVGAQGEGDTCGSGQHKGLCSHIQQDPLYRTDRFDCITFVQDVLALIGANNTDQYQQNLVRINYGVASLLAHQAFKVSFANRNNFISGGFNLVNQKNGLLKDVTGLNSFKAYAKTTSTTINRAAWFANMATPNQLKSHVRVLNNVTGRLMAKRLKNHYGDFFKPQKVSIAYLPENVLAKKQVSAFGQISYQPNEKLIQKIPTPSVLEIVRNAKKWTIDGKNIRSIIKSGINVSHVALLYRDHFKQGQVIYQNIQCRYGKGKACKVTPVICQKSGGCTKVMMAAATDAYPNSYVWSQNKAGRYFCTPAKQVPGGAKVLSLCDRVATMPVGHYLANYMHSASILGVNIEKIQ